MRSNISADLSSRKVSIKWAARPLTKKQKTNDLVVCVSLLAQYHPEGDYFLRHLVLMRGGCFFTTRLLSRQDCSGKNLEKQHRGKPRIFFLLGKFLQQSWVCRGIFLEEFFHQRRTDNAAYYYLVLDEMKQAYRRKRSTLLIDNARPTQKWKKNETSIIVQLPLFDLPYWNIKLPVATLPHRFIILKLMKTKMEWLSTSPITSEYRSKKIRESWYI